MGNVDPATIVHAAVARILTTTKVNDAWNICCEALEELGLHNIIYGAIRLPSWGIVGDGQEALILHRGPQAYADVYIGEELYLRCPTYKWAAENEGFVSWAEAIAQSAVTTSEYQLKIMELNKQYDCLSGFVGSLNNVVPGMRGLVGLSHGRGILQPEADVLWAEIEKDVMTLLQLTHLRIGSLPQHLQRRPLTSRQREALTWSAQGKTMQDIATIMGLSVGTIEKHLRMARDALDAKTTAHAVQKAMSLNLLGVED